MSKDSESMLDAALAYARRGWSIVPVGLNNRKKQCAVRWKAYQATPPGPERLRRWFQAGKYPALAVILGPVSGHLACRDFDDAEAYRRWASEFPELAAMLPTVKTRRGYHVYFTAAVDKTTAYTDGELRGARSMCVLPPSRHPEGGAYQWKVPLADESPLVLDPEQAGLDGQPVLQKRTEENRSRQKQAEADRSRLSAGGGEEDEVALAILSTLPTQAGMRNRQVFQLARALKGIPALADKNAQSLRRIVEEWHRRALPRIETKAFEETWIDFLQAWPNIHTPMRTNLMDSAMSEAKAKPVDNLPYGLEGVRDLAALCRELQGMWKGQPFFLSCRTAGRVLGVGHVTAWRWLFMLEEDGWIKTVAKGGKHRATRFKYLGAGRTEPEAAEAGT